MHKLKSAKIFLSLAALLFVAKPFIGYAVFNSVNPAAVQTILVKAFTKRKVEYVKDSQYDMSAMQKKLAHPVVPIFLLFAFLLSIIFPVALASTSTTTSRFLRSIKLSLSPPEHTWLFNGVLII